MSFLIDSVSFYEKNHPLRLLLSLKGRYKQYFFKQAKVPAGSDWGLGPDLNTIQKMRKNSALSG